MLFITKSNSELQNILEQNPERSPYLHIIEYVMFLIWKWIHNYQSQKNKVKYKKKILKYIIDETLIKIEYLWLCVAYYQS